MADAQDTAKTALADDLVRGVPSGDNHMELHPMGPITTELLQALEQAKADGEEIVGITLYATAWGNLFKEGSGLTGHNGKTRTFQGIPIKPNERDPISPRFVLHPK